MKRIFVFGTIFALTLSAVSLFGQDKNKGSVSLVVGGYSSATTKLEVDLSKKYLGGELYPKETYDLDLPALLMGLGVRVNLVEGKPFYVGGNVLLNPKQKQNSIIFYDLGFLPTRVRSYLVDFNLGTEVPLPSVGQKFVPFVEGGPGILGVYKSVYVPIASTAYGYSYDRLGAGSENNLTGHLGVGARSYLGEEQNFFVGGKLTFYRGAENLRVASFEVGGRF